MKKTLIVTASLLGAINVWAMTPSNELNRPWFCRHLQALY